MEENKMSYIRSGWDYEFVEGVSEDYVFSMSDADGNTMIEDYGYISDAGLVELLFKNWKTDDEVFKQHFLRRLAKRLDVKIRKTPLSWGEVFDRMNVRVKKDKVVQAIIKEMKKESEKK